MQVSLETTGELQRRMRVEVPADQVEREVATRLRSLAQRVRLDGFRPGKVPLKVVERKYGGRVREEVVDEVVQKSLDDALRQENLRPAGGPRIESRQLTPGASLQFTATFEIYPEVVLAPLDDVELERPVADVTDQDVDQLLKVLQRQRQAWEPVERAARRGDRLVIDYHGTVEGGDFPGGSAQHIPVELGEGRLHEGFEEHLTGLQPGATASFDVTYPEDYPKPEVAGKAVHYEVNVRTVSEPRVPELDEAFAHDFGIQEGGMDALRSEVRANMGRELNRAIRARVKDQVMDALLARHAVKVPDALVEEEVVRLQKQLADTASGAGRVAGSPDELRPAAERRVALGLILSELVRAHGIAVDPTRVRASVEEIAASYENPEEVVKWYYGNNDLLSGVESMVLEDQVVEWVSERVRVKDAASTFDALTKRAGR